MNITKDHALFYAGKKSVVFNNHVSIHTLINSQITQHSNWIDKYNDHSKKTFKLNKPFSRDRVIKLIDKYSDSKMYWAIKGYTKFNTSI